MLKSHTTENMINVYNNITLQLSLIQIINLDFNFKVNSESKAYAALASKFSV